MDFTILIVDDELEMCLSLSELLNAKGYATIHTTDPLQSFKLLQDRPIDLLVMDIRMPKLGGLQLLRQVKQEGRQIPIIMISGYPSVENIVTAMKYGAMNFYKKPLNIPRFLEEVQRLAELGPIREPQPDLFAVTSANTQMQKVLSIIRKIAPTNASVIVSGESGTGKELVANALHQLSRRRQKPLIKVNCAAIPHNLQESELFGHEEGSFTDAKKLRRGKFELADGGSLFLDEVADMSQETQAKLLRVLQEQEFERIGGSQILKTDVRIIAATNRDLADLVATGKFREDLYYRLSVINIALPPLRERRQDILPLAEYFLKHFGVLYGKGGRQLLPEVRETLCAHNWPGNVRELKNCMERAVIFCEVEAISAADLPTQYAHLPQQSPVTLHDAYYTLSKQMILDALEQAGGVKKRAAQLLRVHRKTLYNKMRKLGLA